MDRGEARPSRVELCEAAAMQVHLVDGTYEIFRYHFALPSHVTADGQEVAATRGVVGSMLGLLEDGATHVGIATDHVIESFRNDLWPGYKSSEGMPPELLGQFQLLEDVLEAAGFTVFPMVEFEADDAMGAAAAVADADPRVDKVVICTPDKDLGQCVVGDRVVQLDRRKGVEIDAAGVEERFGVAPAVDPRLSRPRRRFGRRLPRPARMGGQVGGRRAGPVRPPRADPGRCRRLGRQRAWRGQARRHPAGPVRARPALPSHRHRRARRPDHHRRRGAALDGAHPASCAPSPNASTPRTSRLAPNAWPRRGRAGARPRLSVDPARWVRRPGGGGLRPRTCWPRRRGGRPRPWPERPWPRPRRQQPRLRRSWPRGRPRRPERGGGGLSGRSVLDRLAGLLALLQTLLELALGGAEGAGELGQLGATEEQGDDAENDEPFVATGHGGGPPAAGCRRELVSGCQGTPRPPGCLLWRVNR